MGAVNLNIKARCRIGELLKNEGRTQTWLANQIGAKQQQVSEWCSGRFSPSPAYILRIMRATGWKFEDMFEEE